MVKMRKLKLPVSQDVQPSEPPLPEPPPSDDGVGMEAPPPVAAPSPERIALTSWRGEFSIRIGSLAEARRSMVVGYLTLVLIPTAVLLVVVALIGVPGTEGTRSLVASIEHMLTVIAVMGLPLMVSSWANGLYAKGSYGRLVSGSVFALLLAAWLALLLLGPDLRDAVSYAGVAVQIDRVIVPTGFIAVFFLGRTVHEFVTCRKVWLKSMGVKVETKPLNLSSGFLDFDLRIGKWEHGNSSAVRAYALFLILPTVLLMVAELLVEELDLEAGGAIVASIDAMFSTVILFGIVLVGVHFVRGFYPSGSVGRTIFGFVGISVLSLFALIALLDSGIEEALGLNHFIIDMYAVLLPILMYVMFMTVFELSELIDNRRQWHKSIGVPVEPYLPEEDYHRIHDFRWRYASFVCGAKKGRKVLDKYAFRRILPIILLEAAVVSVYLYPDSGGFGEAIRSALSDPSVRGQMDLHRTIYVMLLLAVANTAGMFVAWSYREGSMARLVMSGVVAVFASLWAYVYWGSLAGISYDNMVAAVFWGAMIVSIARSGVRALWSLVGVYRRNRSTYLGWRAFMLIKEAEAVRGPSTPATQESLGTCPGTING
jgi:hypothetical protein